jgi:small subunit ribosomal protein S6
LKRYEGMFLFDNTNVHQWSEMEAEVRRLCDRIGAELLVCVKFDERKLAYEIKGRKRGTYVLTYFDADPVRIADLERDASLSEVLLRTLVLRAEHVSPERLAELKALPPDQPLQPISGDGRRGEGSPFRDKRESPTEAKTTTDEPEAVGADAAGATTPARVATATETTDKTEIPAVTDTARLESPNAKTPVRRPAEE